MSSRYDYSDPSMDSDHCDSLSLDPEDERIADERDAADLADRAEAEAASAREFKPFDIRKSQIPAA